MRGFFKNLRCCWPETCSKRVFALTTGIQVKQFGKYQVLGPLGEGGMGVVYRGLDKSMGREVAIKTLTVASEELRQRFQLEARSGVLNHPNIVTVYDFGEQDGSPYIVMELVPGGSLKSLLDAGRQFTLIEKLGIVRQLCLGLGYAHNKGVVHRDIKPANVMVQPEGNVKIVDFGVAQLQSHSAHTQTGMVIGTSEYISPERLRGQSADGRADIWSAGCILYLLLTGRLPFQVGDTASMRRVLSEPHDPISSIVRGYPSDLDQVIDRALAKNPIDRYETAEEMASDLEAINEGLKRAHVDHELVKVKQMIEQQQWTVVRPKLQDLQRLDPQHTQVKKLLREVQEKVSRQKRTEQLQQLLAEAEEAVLSQNYQDALERYGRAEDLDAGNSVLTEKIRHVRGLKERAEQVASLLYQAREARTRSDFGSAGELIDKALELDERNTDLRNERARIIQEAEKTAKEQKRREYNTAGRGQLASRQYTEAIKNLRSALEIDPTDVETQRLYQEAVEREEEQRRRKVIEQIVAEITESLSGAYYERALALIQRALEKLPGEAVLMKLKADAETGYREQTARKLIEKTSLEVLNLFLTDPQEALAIVQKALLQMPGEPRLLALQEKVTEQIKKGNAQEQKSSSLKRAQAAIDSMQFEQAVQILQNAAIGCGEDPEILSLLAYAQEQKRRVELSEVVAKAAREAQSLIEAGAFEKAVALLQPVFSATRDTSVKQLLNEATNGLAELNRQVEALVSRAKALSESRGGLDEAINLLKQQLESTPKSASVKTLLGTLQAKQEQEQLITLQIRAAGEAAQRRDFSGGLQKLETARLAYGESAELAQAKQAVEAERSFYAQDLIGQSIKSAQTALLNRDFQGALEALKSVTKWMEFAEPQQKAEWQRIAESVKEALQQSGTAETGSNALDDELLQIAATKPRKKPVWAIVAGCLAMAMIVGVVIWKLQPHPARPTSTESRIRIAKAPPGATVKIDGGAPQTISGSGELTVPVQPGLRHIVISAPNFDDFPDTVSVDSGLTILENVSMTKSIPVGADTGTFSPLPQPDLAKVRVYVDHELRGEKQAGQEITLKVGTYTVKYAWSGYQESKEHQIVIAKGVNFADRFTLDRAPQTPTTGRLTIQSTANAQVSVDNAVVGSIDPSGHLTIEVPQGSRHLQVTLANFQPSDQQIDIVAGTPRTVIMTLKDLPKPKLPPATIASFTADPSEITQGNAAILSWNVKDTDSISIDPGVDPGGQFLGSRSVKPDKTQTFTLTAIGKDGQPVKGTVTVAVNFAPPPPPGGDTMTTSKTPADPKPAIQAALDSFSAAYNAHDTARMHVIWTGMTPQQSKSFEKLFKDQPNLKIAESCLTEALTVSGDSANWVCSETTTFISEGKATNRTQRMSFRFTKAGASWAIADKR
jgi:serine/threonine protein kinase